MTLMIQAQDYKTTNELLAKVLTHCKQTGEAAQFLVDAGIGADVVQRLRVALTRSRNRNRSRGRKVEVFTLRHSIYPYTDSTGKRHSCVVMWIEKERHHEIREMVDDLLERDS